MLTYFLHLKYMHDNRVVTCLMQTLSYSIKKGLVSAKTMNSVKVRKELISFTSSLKDHYISKGLTKTRIHNFYYFLEYFIHT